MAQAPQIDHNGADVELNMAPAITPFSATPLYATHASGGATVVTAEADPNAPNVIREIWFGYAAAPSAGSYIQIEDGSGTVVWKMPVTTAGLQQVVFEMPKAGSINTAMIVTLSDGTTTGYLYADIYRHK